jgi:hypothetical protein
MKLPRGAAARDHRVEFYEDPRGLSRVVSEFLFEGWERGEALLVIAGRDHLRGITQGLRALEVDLDQAWLTGRMRFLEARQTLARFMRDGRPDPELFSQAVGGALAEALRLRDSDRVCAYGEMVDVLWGDGNREGALQLEEMWNELAERHSFSLLCGYARAHFSAGDHAAVRAICGHHTQALSLAS